MAQPKWAYERGLLWGIELSDPPPRVEPRVRAQFKECTLESVSALARAMDLHDANQVRERLTTGRRGWAALVENEIAAYGWVSVRPEHIGEQEREIKLQANEAYIWDCATLPKFRGQRLYSALLSQMLLALRAEGTRRVWIGSSLTNQPSLRGFANAGFRPALYLSYARLWRLHGLWIGTPRNAPGELTLAARRALIADDERVWCSFAWGWSPASNAGSRAGSGAQS